MKTYIGEIKLYSLSELSNEAQQTAYNQWLNNKPEDYFIDPDIDATLSTFCDIFDVRVSYYTISPGFSDYSFDIYYCNSAHEEGLKGNRIRTWIINNLYDFIVEPKIYFKNGKIRKSRITKTRECSLTGCCYDDAILEPMFSFLDGKTKTPNYFSLIDSCLEKFFDLCAKEAEYLQSFEYFKGYAEDEDLLYNTYGALTILPDGFKVIDIVEG